MYDGIARKSAPYLFLGQTTSLCETCLGLVPAIGTGISRLALAATPIAASAPASATAPPPLGVGAGFAGNSLSFRLAVGCFRTFVSAFARPGAFVALMRYRLRSGHSR